MPFLGPEQIGASLFRLRAERVKPAHLVVGVALIAALCLCVARVTTGYMALAALNYALLVSGLVLRKFRRWHIGAMSLGIAGDLVLVLILELERNAIKTAVSLSLSPLQQAHVTVSAIATVLYIPTLFYGIMRARGQLDSQGRARHLTFGLAAFLFRTLGFIFMFSLLTRKVMGP